MVDSALQQNWHDYVLDLVRDFNSINVVHCNPWSSLDKKLWSEEKLHRVILLSEHKCFQFGRCFDGMASD